MSEPGSQQTQAAVPPAGEGRSVWWVVLPAVAFVLGIVLGGVVVGVAQDDDPVQDEARSPAPSRGTASPGPSSGATVVVPQRCLDAADTVDEAVRVIRKGAVAVRELRARDLVDLLNRLEDLDARARDQAQACRGTEVDTTQDTESPSASPTG